MSGLTERQKQRQIDKIYGVIFTELNIEDEEEVPEGQMKVEMSSDVREIFMGNLPIGEEIEIKDLEIAMALIVEKLVEYVCKQKPNINMEYAQNILSFIVADLVSMNLSYSEMTSSANFDPMFG